MPDSDMKRLGAEALTNDGLQLPEAPDATPKLTGERFDADQEFRHSAITLGPKWWCSQRHYTVKQTLQTFSFSKLYSLLVNFKLCKAIHVFSIHGVCKTNSQLKENSHLTSGVLLLSSRSDNNVKEIRCYNPSNSPGNPWKVK
ncbi:uncharacterized protein LACBIDRAFT_328506 [Laccaria bicolor S238N-H82]|uniref:Predicted protein n=1 Tax=Laccaria bicolor (strain S238N-H82 / ATCC MYA-4686) TaxID=486041 RepID=B0DF23_LACBS|nr:uncharacterized protein LACBIDRAFT_328506 [Laccaria bicolor S238N-H82]EDR06645.1 predicted protein [Laccaria bicolor S238N-H82]|eukprot:XP_001882492.1 predicted protein [Laccaria bicolor S238N-H82]